MDFQGIAIEILLYDYSIISAAKRKILINVNVNDTNLSTYESL